MLQRINMLNSLCDSDCIYHGTIPMICNVKTLFEVLFMLIPIWTDLSACKYNLTVFSIDIEM